MDSHKSFCRAKHSKFSCSTGGDSSSKTSNSSALWTRNGGKINLRFAHSEILQSAAASTGRRNAENTAPLSNVRFAKFQVYARTRSEGPLPALCDLVGFRPIPAVRQPITMPHRGSLNRTFSRDAEFSKHLETDVLDNTTVRGARLQHQPSLIERTLGHQRSSSGSLELRLSKPG